MTQPIQSRGDWPSASAWSANRLCPGRHLANVGKPDTSADDEDAESGRAIHAAWAGNPIRELKPDEQESLEAFQQKEAMILRSWAPNGLPVEHHPNSPRELRLWHSFYRYSCSGMPDLIYFDPPRVLLLDGKRGRKKVEPEPQNLQLRILAALVAVNGEFLCGEPITEVTVALVQHWAASNPPCVYDCYALARSVEEMERDVKAWYEPNAPRIAGAVQCEFCKAKADCGAFSASGLPVNYRVESPAPTSEQVVNAIARMDGPRLGTFLALSRLAEDCASQEVRKRLAAAPGSVSGWQLSPGRTTESITNLQALHGRFLGIGGTTEQFLKALKALKGELKNIVREVTNAKGKELDLRMSSLLDGITESKTGNPVLERE